jgi:hypothetical protein
MNEQNSQKHEPRLWLWFVLFAIFLACVTVGVLSYRVFNKMTLNTPEFRESRMLMDTGRKQPLTQAEFDRAIVLLDNSELVINISMISLLEVEAVRDAERKKIVIAEIEKILAQSDKPSTKKSAFEKSLERLKK